MALWGSAELVGELKMEEAEAMGEQKHQGEEDGQARGRPRGRARAARSAGPQRGAHAHLVERHLEDGLRRAALLLGAQVVAQLLRHLLHHVVPQLHVAHLRPRVLVVLDELGQVEPQALAEFVEDPEGAGKAGEGAAVGIGVPSAPHPGLKGGEGAGRAPGPESGGGQEAGAGLHAGSSVPGMGMKWERGWEAGSRPL